MVPPLQGLIKNLPIPRAMLWAITGRPFGAGEVVWGEEVGAEGIEAEEERGVLRVERAEVGGREGKRKEAQRRHKGGTKEAQRDRYFGESIFWGEPISERGKRVAQRTQRTQRAEGWRMRRLQGWWRSGCLVWTRNWGRGCWGTL